MTSFEQMLIDKGYLKFILDGRPLKFREEVECRHNLSTMSNLDYFYYHNTDPVLAKIAAGKSPADKDFTLEDRRGEICFGLNENNKPPTLISPRPRILIKRTVEGTYQDERDDDSMNIVLRSIPNEEIYMAMYNRSVCFKLNISA